MDLATGNRTLVADRDTGAGPPFVQPRELCPGPTEASLLIAHTDSPAILVLERVSGDRVYLTKD